MTHPVELPPLSRVFPAHELDETAMDVHFEATAEERDRLTRHLGVTAVEACAVDASLTLLDDGLVQLSGALAATVAQPCSVTLEPISSPLEARFVRHYSPKADPEAWGDGWGAGESVEIEGLDAAEPPEPLSEDGIDIGAVATEELALLIDPFPRKEGVKFEDVVGDPERNDGAPNPFAVLASLKTPKPDDGDGGPP